MYKQINKIMLLILVCSTETMITKSSPGYGVWEMTDLNGANCKECNCSKVCTNLTYGNAGKGNYCHGH